MLSSPRGGRGPDWRSAGSVGRVVFAIAGRSKSGPVAVNAACGASPSPGVPARVSPGGGSGLLALPRAARCVDFGRAGLAIQNNMRPQAGWINPRHPHSRSKIPRAKPWIGRVHGIGLGIESGRRHRAARLDAENGARQPSTVHASQAQANSLRGDRHQRTSRLKVRYFAHERVSLDAQVGSCFG